MARRTRDGLGDHSTGRGVGRCGAGAGHDRAPSAPDRRPWKRSRGRIGEPELPAGSVIVPAHPTDPRRAEVLPIKQVAFGLTGSIVLAARLGPVDLSDVGWADECRQTDTAARARRPGPATPVSGLRPSRSPRAGWHGTGRPRCSSSRRLLRPVHRRLGLERALHVTVAAAAVAGARGAQLLRRIETRRRPGAKPPGPDGGSGPGAGVRGFGPGAWGGS